MHRINKDDQKRMAAAGSALKPKWTEGPNGKAPPSNTRLDEQAKKAARRLFKHADRHASRHLKSTASSIAQGGIVNKANGLFKACETLACPREDGRRQRLMTSKVRRLIARQELPKDWVLLSPISEIGMVKPDDLTKIGRGGGTTACKAVFEHLIDVLKESGVQYAIGGLDITFCVDKREIGKLGFKGPNFARHWMIHLTVMMPHKDYLRAKTALHEAYPKADLVPKPLVVKDWDGNPRTIAYTFKRIADVSADLCRETYISQKESKDTPSQNTRLVKLGAKQKNDLSVMLDQLAPDCRYLLWGLRPVNGEDGLTIEIDA